MVRNCWVAVICGASVLFHCGGGAERLGAADAPRKGAAPAAADTSGDPVKQWNRIMARREEIRKTFHQLEAEAEAADPARRREIQKKFQLLVDEFQADLSPKAVALAPRVLEKDPNNMEAAEVVAGILFHENMYEKAAAMVDRYDAAKKATPVLLTIGGGAHFAIHDFEKAQEMLTRAQKADPDIFQQLGSDKYLAACADYIELWKTEQTLRAKEAEANDLPQVALNTSKGTITVELFENQAPNTVANFISLVEGKKYDGIAFHRVVPNFMAQGGDPNTLDGDPTNDGQGGPGYTIACECYREDARRHFQGSLSMAHAGKDSGGSQFFITHMPTPHLNPSPPNAPEPHGHTVFGRVVKGLDVAESLEIGDKIETAKVIRKRNHPYVPKKNKPSNFGKE